MNLNKILCADFAYLAHNVIRYAIHVDTNYEFKNVYQSINLRNFMYLFTNK